MCGTVFCPTVLEQSCLPNSILKDVIENKQSRMSSEAGQVGVLSKSKEASYVLTSSLQSTVVATFDALIEALINHYGPSDKDAIKAR